MNESDFIEGGSLNSFGEKFDFQGKDFKINTGQLRSFGHEK